MRGCAHVDMESKEESWIVATLMEVVVGDQTRRTAVSMPWWVAVAPTLSVGYHHGGGNSSHSHR